MYFGKKKKIEITDYLKQYQFLFLLIYRYTDILNCPCR